MTCVAPEITKAITNQKQIYVLLPHSDIHAHSSSEHKQDFLFYSVFAELRLAKEAFEMLS